MNRSLPCPATDRGAESSLPAPESAALDGNVWITGAGGLIGHYLVQDAHRWAPGASAVGLTRQKLDLSDRSAVESEFSRSRPVAVVHCAALSKSPACQADPRLAHKLNVEATAHLSDLAGAIPFVFFSTDLVFDGRQGNYDESAEINPLSVYAETKAEAEQAVLKNPRHTVVRTSLNGGASPTGDRGFNEEMRRAWATGRTLRLFTDEFRCPIAAEVTARAVWELLLRGSTGLFHVAGSERLSRWQIGQLIAQRWPDPPPKLEPASLKEYKGAPRAPDTSLDCSKAQQCLSFPLPGLTEWLARHPEGSF